MTYLGFGDVPLPLDEPSPGDLYQSGWEAIQRIVRGGFVPHEITNTDHLPARLHPYVMGRVAAVLAYGFEPIP